MKWKSLRARFLFIVLLTLVLPFTLMLSLSYLSTARMTRAFIATDLSHSASRLLEMIPVVRDDEARSLRVLVEDVNNYAYATPSPEKRRRVYHEKLKLKLAEFMANRWHIFDGALQMDRNGGLLAKFVWISDTELRPVAPVYVETRRFTREDSSWATHWQPLPPYQSWLSPPVIGKAGFVQALGFPVYVQPPFENRNEFMGTLFFFFRLDYLFREAAARAQLTPEQWPIVFDSQGTVLYHPRREHIAQKLSVVEPELMAGLTARPRNSGQIARVDHNGWFLAYARQEHWIVGVASHRPALLTKPRQIYLLNAALIVLTLVFAAWTVILATSRVSRSMAEVARGADAIARGDLEKKLPVRSEDEIGTLARAFNSMADSLRAMIQERVEKEKLKELNELKSAFISNVSHELRQPLGHILIAVDNLRKGLGGQLSSKQRDYLNKVRANTVALMHMIGELLDLSRIEAGRLSLEVSKVSLDRVVADVFEEATHLWKEKDLTLSYRADEEITFQADEEKLKEIIGNLVDNAIKYTPRGGKITVSAWLEDQEVKIVVEDTGIGIPPEHLYHLFERFYQVRDSRVEKNPGLGLGLNIVKTLVELHGGTVHVESEVGIGTRVSVRMPLSQRESPVVSTGFSLCSK